MTYAAFFKSRSFGYGAGAGAVAASLGTLATLLAAFNMSSRCSSFVDSCESIVAQNINIPKLTFDVDIDNTYTTSVALYNIETPFPPEWAEIINYVKILPDYCFKVPVTIGLSLTFVISLTLASYVTSLVHIREQADKNDTPQDYSPLDNVI